MLVLAVIAVACSGAGTRAGNPLVASLDAPPDDVRAGCDIAAVKCTRCHTVDRLLRARVSSPQGWQRYVGRMRLMPGAGISSHDEPKIVRCLVFRSFGTDGLGQLEEGAH